MKKASIVVTGSLLTAMTIGLTSAMAATKSAKTKPHAFSAHLASVLFMERHDTDVNGLDEYLGIFNQDHAGQPDTFVSAVSINPMSTGTHTIKEYFYDPKGRLLSSASNAFINQNATGHVEFTTWKITTGKGFNTLKVYVDGHYLGYGVLQGQ